MAVHMNKQNFSFIVSISQNACIAQLHKRIFNSNAPGQTQIVCTLTIHLST